ncbi:sialate O-acetylesterase [Sphingomonas sp. 1P08PE]|uniref:sialate O-acetylesterase n=1 Tax=Sphingomonas sp. 1P08PE TaxID=554122 RepID=UPI0039A0941B
MRITKAGCATTAPPATGGTFRRGIPALMSLWLVASTVIGTPAPAQVRGEQGPVLLARIFGDHGVLQRDRPIPVWGQAAPRAEVIVTLGGNSVTVRTGADGRWRTTLPPMAASGPYRLIARSGAAIQTLTDILVGDVYLCGGQSNMEFPARRATGAWGGVIPRAIPVMRYAHVERDSQPGPLADFAAPVPWKIVDPQSVGDASAVCFHMAATLQRHLNVPIGFIESFWGGTTIENWIPAPALGTIPSYRAGLGTLALAARDPDAGLQSQSGRDDAWWRTHYPSWQVERVWRNSDFDASAWRTVRPGVSEDSVAKEPSVSWYRQTITLTAVQAAAASRIGLGTIDRHDTVWINDRWVGANDADWFWRDYPLRPGVLRAGRNVIVLRVVGRAGLTGDPAQRAIVLTDGRRVPLSDIWSYHEGGAVPAATPPIAAWQVPDSLSTLYNGMVAPLGNYGVRLVAWYQGEANVGDPVRYRQLLPMLMANWRRQFDQPGLPFMVAQIASFGSPPIHPGDAPRAALRDVQAKVVRADPAAGLAVTFDISDRFDVHSPQKRLVGERLARAARAIVYGEAISAGGPQVRTVSRDGGDLVVAFDGAQGGLFTYGGDVALGFEACVGSDCRYAAGQVEGGMIRLRGAYRPGTDRVRYAWADAPFANLYGADDLPAVPFAAEVR